MTASLLLSSQSQMISSKDLSVTLQQIFILHSAFKTESNVTPSLGISPADKTSLSRPFEPLCLCAGGNNGRFIGVILFNSLYAGSRGGK